RVLKEVSRTQGNLSKFDQWRVDLEEPGEDVRWTIAFRAMIAQTSASVGLIEWNPDREKELPCLFLFDAVLALGSDLTFFMAARAWMNTNYYDFDTDKNGVRDHPLAAAFVLLSTRRRRLLANLSSNPGAEFGDHPPLPDFVKTAIRSSNFSATLL